MAHPHEFDSRDVREVIAIPGPNDDKYSRGVVGLVTGSREYPGAAVLGAMAAYRVGVGMVRYVGPSSVGKLVLHARPEVVLGTGQVDAWVVGSGISALARSSSLLDVLSEVFASDVPVVVDAGALDLLTRIPHSDHIIVTPHIAELSRIMTDATATESSWSVAGITRDPLTAAYRAADELGVVVSLKGHVTNVVAPVSGDERTVMQVTSPTSWLATAGTGDVLAGSLGSILATAKPQSRDDIARCSAAAVFLNGHAAAHASRGGPILAMDVAMSLPEAVREVLSQ